MAEPKKKRSRRGKGARDVAVDHAVIAFQREAYATGRMRLGDAAREALTFVGGVGEATVHPRRARAIAAFIDSLLAAPIEGDDPEVVAASIHRRVFSPHFVARPDANRADTLQDIRDARALITCVYWAFNGNDKAKSALRAAAAVARTRKRARKLPDTMRRRARLVYELQAYLSSADPSAGERFVATLHDIDPELLDRGGRPRSLLELLDQIEPQLRASKSPIAAASKLTLALNVFGDGSSSVTRKTFQEAVRKFRSTELR